MGCSNPHPHGQIWASDYLPNEIAKEDQQQLDYYHTHQRPMLLDVVKQELATADALSASIRLVGHCAILGSMAF